MKDFQIEQWINENKECVTLYGTEGTEVIPVGAVRELLETLVYDDVEGMVGAIKEYQRPNLLQQSIGIGVEGSEESSLEEGMFSKLPMHQMPQELLDAIQGQSHYEVSHYLYHIENAYFSGYWKYISFANGEVDIDDQTDEDDRILTKEIPYSEFLGALKQ